MAKRAGSKDTRVMKIYAGTQKLEKKEKKKLEKISPCIKCVTLAPASISRFTSSGGKQFCNNVHKNQ